jgi:hypothetical protein
MSALFTPRNSRVVVDADGVHVVADGNADISDAERAYRARSQRLQDAYRGGPDRATTQTLDHIRRKRELSEAYRHADAGGPQGTLDAEAAYDAFKARLQSAWKAPPPRDPPWLKVQPRNYRPGLASYDPGGDAADSADLHFDDDDPQAVRDEAHAAYCDRIRNAWRS